jgi:hypothetical protein
VLARGFANDLFTICRQSPVMRAASIATGLVVLSLLPGCLPVPVEQVTTCVVAGTGSPSHCSAADTPASAAAGRNCSMMVNLRNGERYCWLGGPALETPEFCTRSLGIPDCWRDPAKLLDHPREIADGPRALTEAQEADRRRWWPRLW